MFTGDKNRKIPWNEIVMIVYDFDGVMTDNRVIVSQDGSESVMVSRADGQGVGMIRTMGIDQMILSTEVNPVVERRAEKLKIPVIHGVKDKRKSMEEYCALHSIDEKKVFFIGNDVNDRGVMEFVGWCGAPKDAEEEILSIADWISEKNGGYGVVRTLAREIGQNR